MASTIKWLSGSVQSVPFNSTGINSLTNNSLIGSSGIDTGSSNLSILTEVEGIFNYTVAPTASTGFSVWFLRSLDGVNWESGNTGFTPARIPDAVLPLAAVAGNQRVTVVALIPPGNFTVLAKNDGTGQTTASTLNDIRLRPLTYQVV